MTENTRGIVAIELLAAGQGIDFRRPLRSSEALEVAYTVLREQVAFYDHDRHFAPDIEAAKEVLDDPRLLGLPGHGLVPSGA